MITLKTSIQIIFLLLIFNLIAIRRNSIFILWYFIEIRSFTFIYIIIIKKNPIKSSIIYFIMRFLVTTLLFLAISLNNYNIFFPFISLSTESNYYIFISSSFFLKIGVIPFHYWVFKIIENIEWIRIIILTTLQKLIPIIVISFIIRIKIFFISIIFRIILMPAIPINTKNSFFLIASSRTINNIWIVRSSLFSVMTITAYILIYFISNTNFITNLKINNRKTINRKNSINSSLHMLALIGFPPFPIFFLKIIFIKNIFFIINSLTYFLAIIIFINIISSIIYIKFNLISIIGRKNIFSFNININKIIFSIIIFPITPIIFLTTFNLN